jgi:hypothetical protein
MRVARAGNMPRLGMDMTRRYTAILLLLCMLPNMAGLGMDKVLCIGNHGHLAIEPAMMCVRVTCASLPVTASRDEQPRPQPAAVSTATCGSCTDIPGAASFLSASPAQDAFAFPLTEMVLLVLPAIHPGDGLIVPGRAGGAASPMPGGNPSILTIVLLI